jgi:hypothetical protein
MLSTESKIVAQEGRFSLDKLCVACKALFQRNRHEGSQPLVTKAVMFRHLPTNRRFTTLLNWPPSTNADLGGVTINGCDKRAPWFRTVGQRPIGKPVAPSLSCRKEEGSMKKLIAGLFCSAFLLCSSVIADSRDKKTILRFQEEVELPGIVLPPGTYVFKVPDFNYRDIVQVYTEDESKLLTTLIGISAERLQGTDRTAVRFGESRQASGDQLQTWFYPQEETGREFVYSKQRSSHVGSR